ncbi:MAG TPA: beta-ketoacyl-[acyl-carrier-protein] synthase family protein [Methylomirabilota bacterium]|jgi:3-oxoacyl-(acyl-carrier-protein) synthase|nr:beta-ketoacyl-[acyl-carrier-protein] synthase family protein [Methylomirabilota bacterium]
MRPAEPVAIIAAGVVTPIGQDVEAFWSSLVTGASGISQIERFPVADMRVGRGGEIKKLTRIKSWGRVHDCRATRLLVSACDELVGQAAFRPLPLAPARVAVVVGTALGGVEEGEKALAGDWRRRRLRGALYDAPAHALARWLGATGPVITVSTACASGATALAVGADLLRQGEADAVVAGGYDILCRFVMRGFDALRSLTRDVVRPFDRRRNGLLLGEAAALVLLRRERDAGERRLGRLLGYGSASDASHIAAPDPGGLGLERAIRASLAQAGVTADDLDFVSAHGTGTPLNDRIETAVLKRVLGARAPAIPVNSIKASMGHTMGAAATLEAIMCLLSSRHGLIPPTLNLEEPDPECDLDYVPGRARAARPRLSLSTSLGFGGCNAALVLEGLA